MAKFKSADALRRDRCRSRWRRWSYAGLLLGLLPITVTHHVIIALYGSTPNTAATILSFVYVAQEAIVGFMVMQILIWWQWKPPAERRRTTMLKLLLTFLLGNVIGVTSIQFSFNIAIGFFPAVAIQLGFLSLNAIANWCALVVVGCVTLFRFHDKHQNTETLDKEPSRERLSISSLMLVTSFAAILMVFLRWTRAFYSGSEFAEFLVVRDEANVILLITTSLVRVFCLIAAALAYSRKNLPVAFLLIVVALSTSVGGGVLWLIASGFPASSLTIDSIITPLVAIVAMVVLHLIAFRFWSTAGFGLAIGANEEQLRSKQGVKSLS
ncbi:MAG: hypothetical protein AAF664_16145 [Planctomycetota bacterium]